jgi:hypothetical protein
MLPWRKTTSRPCWMTPGFTASVALLMMSTYSFRYLLSVPSDNFTSCPEKNAKSIHCHGS